METGSQHDYNSFSDLRSRCKQLKDVCYDRYIVRMEQNITADPSLFWRHVSSFGRTGGYPASMSLDGRSGCDGGETVGLFADFFSSVYAGAQPVIPDYYKNLNDCIDIREIKINLQSVFNAIECSKPKLTSGPDGVPPYLLKGCIFTLSRPLWLLFNISIKKGTFPSFWKSFFITTIFKSGDRSNVTN